MQTTPFHEHLLPARSSGVAFVLCLLVASFSFAEPAASQSPRLDPVAEIAAKLEPTRGKHGYLMFERELYLDTLTKTGKFLASLEMLPR